MAVGKSSVVSHGVTRALIALLLVGLAVLVGSGFFVTGREVVGVLFCIGGVVLGGLVWRDR